MWKLLFPKAVKRAGDYYYRKDSGIALRIGMAWEWEGRDEFS